MYYDPNIASSYGLNMQNPTAQFIMGAGNTAPSFNSLQNNGYYQNPMAQNYYCSQQPQAYMGGYMGLPDVQVQQQPQMRPWQNYDIDFSRSMEENRAEIERLNSNPAFNTVFGSGEKQLSTPIQNQAYYNNTPSWEQNNYGYYNNPIADQEQHEYNTMKQMYLDGAIGIGQYAAMANGGIEHTTPNNTVVFQQCQPSPIYTPYGYAYQQNAEYYQHQQELYNNNAEAFSIASRVVNRFFGINEKEAALRAEHKKKYEESLQRRLQEEAIVEMQNTAFADAMKKSFYSDQKGYISPEKKKIIEHYNKVWERRHKHIPEDYTMYDLQYNGLYAEIIFDDMRYYEKERMKNLVMLYDDTATRNIIAGASPFYNPFTGTSMRGFKINKNEITITVPPEIVAERYKERREIFLDSTYRNYDVNIPDDVSYMRTYRNIPGVLNASLNSQ